MSLIPGTRLGAYEVVAPLGTGGMGEVYRARDTKLDRDVALKILPDAFASDVERLGRFEREAKTLAALNHPNIAHIHGFEQVDGTRALVMELVEGEDLSQRIARGPLPIDEAVPIARQVIDALGAAHEQGIIHRDLKPANIKVRDDGTVKVLDFGLAKALDPLSPTGTAGHPSLSPTLTAATQMGVILGTAAYMSPEQARGKQVDKRADIWAFGCVLYEMLAGRRAFEGEEVSDTLAAVLRAEPDWAALPQDIPQAIGILIRRCLEKDPRRRIADISTAAFLLDEPLAGPAPLSAASAAPVKGWSRAASIAAVLALVAIASALAAFAAWSVRPAPPSAIITRFSVMLGEDQTFTNRTAQIVSISPDGSKIVYVANRRLYLRSMSDQEARAIPGTELNPRNPVFSPDGASVVFGAVSLQSLKKVAVTGGAPVTVAPLNLAPLGISWAGEDILFGDAESRGISRVPASGGKPELIVKVNADEYAHGPEMLPDGKHVLFTLARGTPARWDTAEIVVQSLETNERRTLIQGGSDARYVSTGHILYALGGVVFAVRFDVHRLQMIGGPVPVIEGVLRGEQLASGQSAATHFSVSTSGSLVYVRGPVSAGIDMQTLGFVDRKGTVELLKLTPGPYREPRISPDGKQVAFGSEDEREAAVWVYDLAGTSSMRRLTFGGKNRHPVWSPDGQRIAFQSDREGDLAVFWQRADGSGSAERLTKPEQDTAHTPESWSPDGKTLLVGVSKGKEFWSEAVSLNDKKTTQFGNIRSLWRVNAAFSPDGKWVAYSTQRDVGSRVIYVQPFPPTGAIYQITRGGPVMSEGGHHPFWSRDGRELYYIPDGGRLAFVTIATRPTFSFGAPVFLPRGVPGFRERGPGNPRQNDSTSDNRVIGVFPAGETPGTAAEHLQVVLNWFEELKTRVPAR